MDRAEYAMATSLQKALWFGSGFALADGAFLIPEVRYYFPRQLTR
jgi:hypothetical protein